MKLEDGRGTGVLAEVDDTFRLQVASVSSDRAVLSNIDGEAFGFSSNFHDIAAATETRLAYIKNTETLRSLVIDGWAVSTDGGSSTFIRPTYLRVYQGASTPTANNTVKDAGGLNTETSKRAEADFEIWDGVGSGLTQATAGNLFSESIYSKGCTDQRLPARVIIGPTKTITFSFECPEAAKVSIIVWSHLLSESESN